MLRIIASSKNSYNIKMDSNSFGEGAEGQRAQGKGAESQGQRSKGQRNVGVRDREEGAELIEGAVG